MKPFRAEIRCFERYDSGVCNSHFPVVVVGFGCQEATVVMAEGHFTRDYGKIVNDKVGYRRSNPFAMIGHIPDVGDVFRVDIQFLKVDPGLIDGVGE